MKPQSPRVSPEIVSVKNLARMLDVSPKTIWDWIYKSRRHSVFDPIPYHKLGALIRFDINEVRAWVSRRRVRTVDVHR